MVRQKLTLILRRESETTRVLCRYINQNKKLLSDFYILNTIYLNSNNIRKLKQMGITSTPTAICGNVKLEGSKKIISFLSNAISSSESLSNFYTTPEEAVRDMQNKYVWKDYGKPDEDDDDIDKKLKQGMMQMQKRREQSGMGSESKQQSVRSNTKQVSEFDNDDQFLDMADADNNSSTNWNMEMSGDNILEDYYADAIHQI